MFDIGETGGGPPEGVRLLPWWDTLFVTWRDRTRFLPEALNRFVYDASGNAVSAVLADGEVAGVWSLGDGKRGLEIWAAPFDSFTDAQWEAIEVEAGRVARLGQEEPATLVRASDPPNLLEGRRNLFMRPLAG